MYSWLPGACRDIHNQICEIYWLLLVPVTLFIIVLEYFKLPDKSPNIPLIIKRVFISMLLLMTFDETLTLISFVGDGIADKIGGLNNIHKVLDELWKAINRVETGWTRFKESVIFIFSLLSYILAYLGAFIADAIINFCWSILYCVAPLMILSYIPEQTAGTCKSLYKNLCTIMCWKILWSVLGVLLLRFSMNAPVQGSDYNAILLIVMNLFIGLSMLFVPFATKSLINDGLSSFASATAGAAAFLTKRVVMDVVKKGAKGGFNFAGQRMKNSFQNLQNFRKQGRELNNKNIAERTPTKNNTNMNKNNKPNQRSNFEKRQPNHKPVDKSK